MDLGAIFKAYDVRGTYPDQLDEVTSHGIGAAFARFSGSSTIIVGRDMRLSSEPLARAFIEGANGQGVDVVDIGLVSTDALYFASGRYELPGAMFTASHNPAQYNGIKFCRSGAAPVSRETGLEDVRRLAEEGLPPGGKVGTVGQRDVVDDFVDHLLGLIDPTAIRPFKIAIDAANGMAGKMAPPLFDRLPIEIVPLYFELDGTFPNHPADPIQPDNLVDLQEEVTRSGADLGLAFDGDSDRVFVVDNEAGLVSGSLTAAVVTARVLERNPGSPIVYSLICSRVVPETILAAGGHPIRSRVGHSFIKQVMADTGAAFGGEHSGHYYFKENFRADSGFACALFLLDALSVGDSSLTNLLLPYRRYWNSGEVNTEVADQEAKIRELAETYRDGTQDWTDGLTVDYADWWFNVRPSNTEPLLRLNVESVDQDFGISRTEEILKLIR